jgi:hypothetical protein
VFDIFPIFFRKSSYALFWTGVGKRNETERNEAEKKVNFQKRIETERKKNHKFKKRNETESHRKRNKT